MVIGDFVSQLAWCRNLDTSSPVRIDVAQTISEVFKDLFGQIIRLIAGDEIVDGHDTALGCLLGYEEEVEFVVSIFILNETRIKDCSRFRIHELPLVANEHPLVDSLVDDDKSDLGLG